MLQVSRATHSLSLERALWASQKIQKAQRTSASGYFRRNAKQIAQMLLIFVLKEIYHAKPYAVPLLKSRPGVVFLLHSRSFEFTLDFRAPGFRFLRLFKAQTSVTEAVLSFVMHLSRHRGFAGMPLARHDCLYLVLSIGRSKLQLRSLKDPFFLIQSIFHAQIRINLSCKM